jgi:hypothetical protein
MKHEYSILRRVPGTYRNRVRIGYRYAYSTPWARTYGVPIFVFATGTRVVQSCGTRVVHESKKIQFFSFSSFIRFFLFIGRFMFFYLFIILK